MAKQEQKKPNILILWGDDIGIWNISHFSRGMMGYQTPNIDRVAKEGVTFTDYYAQQSCTAAARASLPARIRSAPASPRSACPAPRSACRRKTRPLLKC